jgi:Xaa-Pro aminopeptidase
MFRTDIYQSRRKKLIESLDTGHVLFMGNSLVGMNYKDNAYPMIQDGSFLYYFGLDAPDLAGLIDIDEQKSYLVGDSQSLMAAVFMGDAPSVQFLGEKSGCDAHLSFEKLALRLQSDNRQVHTLPQYREDNALRLKKILGNTQIKPSNALILAVINQREVKAKEELQDMREGMKVTKAMHLMSMQKTAAGQKEIDVVAELVKCGLVLGRQLAYQPIFSVDGHILHNHHYENVMRSGQLVLNDSGWNGPNRYATDITRTFPVSGRFTSRQREIYEIVLQMQQAALDTIKSGRVYQQSHIAAAKSGLEGLAQLGLIKGNIDDALNQGAYGLFFPHGLGHLIGLDVHDMEGLGEDFFGYDQSVSRSNQFGLSALRLGKSLRSNMVITVEPGIYFIPSLIEKWRAEKKLNAFICYDKLESYLTFGGVRIEDNIRVTHDGFDNLSVEIPKSLSDVEAACAAN